MRAIALLLVCACGSKESEPPPPTKLPPAEVRPPQDLGIERLPQPAADLPKQLSFRLLDPGKGEAATLRYAVAGQETTTRIETVLSSRVMENGTWGPLVALPPIRTAITVAAKGSGQLRAQPKPGEIVGAASPMAESYLARWKASENRPLAIGFDGRGQLGALAFEDDPQASRSREAVDELTQRLLTVLVPVPEEKVAVGASWRVVTALYQHPVVVKQTATYTLLARTPAGWKVGVEIQRVGEEQTIADPAVAKDAMVDLVALVRHYKGTLEIATGQAIPQGKLEIDATMHLRVQPRSGQTFEQMFEDRGTVTLGPVP